jgi:hypothetical protein
MNTNMESQTQQQTTQGTQRQAAADTTPAPASPEQLVDQLRVVRQQFGDLPVLTPQQRENFRGLVRTTNSSVQTSINVIGASDTVSMAVGQPATQVQAMVTEANRWTAVEDELRAMLTSISDANLKRRHEIALVTAQAYAIGTQLARKPENGGLQTHLKEIKRLRGLGRRKKGSAGQTPSTPSTPSTTQDGTVTATPGGTPAAMKS